MPARCASRVDVNAIDLPRKNIAPASGCSSPLMIFISVDLPAPFSPHTACTSPRFRSKSTSCSAVTAWNLLVIPRKRRRGGGRDAAVPSSRSMGPAVSDAVACKRRLLVASLRDARPLTGLFYGFWLGHQAKSPQMVRPPDQKSKGGLTKFVLAPGKSGSAGYYFG